VCDSCQGQAIPEKVLARIVGMGFSRRLNRISRVKGGQEFRKCLSCGTTMDNFTYENDDETDQRNAIVRICPSCRMVWLDGEDRRQFDSMLDDERLQDKKPRQPQTEASVDRLFSTESPSAIGWKLIPALMLLPVECGTGTERKKPIGTWITAGLLAIVLAWTFGFSDWKSLIAAVRGWGLIPSEMMRQGGLTLITSFFLHAGCGHLLGNLYFLMVFGEGLEDDLGWLGFICVMLAGHLGGMLLQILVSTHMHIPIVGASAGVSGVLGCYAVLLARTRLGWLIVIPVKWTPVILKVPALAALAAYAVQQSAYAMSSPDASIAFAAHLGGLTVGALWGLAVVQLRNKRDPSTEH